MTVHPHAQSPGTAILASSPDPAPLVATSPLLETRVPTFGDLHCSPLQNRTPVPVLGWSVTARDWKYLQGGKTRQEVNSEPDKEEIELRELKSHSAKVFLLGEGEGL